MALEQGQKYASYTGAHYLLNQDGDYVPVLTRMLNLAGETKPQVEILHSSKRTVPLTKYFKVAAKSGLLLTNTAVPVQARYLGKYRQLPLYALDIYPVQYHASNRQLEWISELEVRISIVPPQSNRSSAAIASLKDAKFVGSLVLNGKQTYSEALPSKTEKVQADDKIFKSYATIYKLQVDEDAIYKVTYNDLVEADFPVDLINPVNLRMFNKGSEIPIYIFGSEDGHFDEGDFFEFWGEKNKKTFIKQHPDMYADPFSDINVYWLVNGHTPGRRMPEESGGLMGNANGYIFEPYAYTETLHFERDRFNEKFGHSSAEVNHPSYEYDHWFFDSGISAPEGIAYDFYLPHPFESGSGVVVTAALRGKSYYNNPTNLLQGHQVELKLRGKGDVAKLIGRVIPSDGWKDQQPRFISNADSSVKLSQSVLINGNNRLEVDMFQTGVTDMVLLNWFDISYKRKYRAYQNFIKFHVDDEFFNNSYVHLGDNIQINVDGFDTDDISVYKLGVSKIVNGKIGYVLNDNYASHGISIQDQIFDPTTEYVAVTESAKKKPLSIRAFKRWKEDQPTWTLLNKDNAADYLIITHSLLYDTALKLRDLKAQQGLHPLVVTVENIYDIFNMGIKSPLAIKEFIRYALHNWKADPPLKYVVLVGSASYDYKGILKPGADLVPTFMYQTVKFGSASSDNWYALLDGDDYIPDLCVARIPASTNQELLNYIDKVEHYNSDEDVSEWRNRSLYISGNDAGKGDKEAITLRPIFRTQNLRLIGQQMPESVFANRLNTVKNEQIGGYDPNFGSTTDLIEYFDNGLSYINYLGHGGGGIWADVELLNLSDVDRLNNEYKLPFIASMTCYTGDYSNPGRLGLAEKLLLSEKKGAIALLAASGVGWKYNDFAIEWGLFDYLWNKNLSFGDAVNLMKIYYLANPVYVTEIKDMYTYGYGTLKYSMVSQYNLLGDPSLSLKQPQQTLSVTASTLSPAAGDTVQFTINGGPPSGSGHIIVSNQEDTPVLDSYFSNTPGKQITFPLPDSSSGNSYTAKVYVSDGTTDASGSGKIAVQAPIIKQIAINPLKPKVNQSIDFTITLNSFHAVVSMELIQFRDFNQVYGSALRVPMTRISDSLFQSAQPFTGFATGGQKYFDISITTDDGKTVLIRRQKLNIEDTRPDLQLVSGSLEYSGTTQLQLSFSLENASDSTLSAVEISCYDTTVLAGQQPFARLSYNLNAREQKTVSVSYNATRMVPSRTFYIVIDPDNAIAESNESNNTLQQTLLTDRILVTKSIGTSADGLTNGKIALTDNWTYYVAPNGLPSSGVIRFEPYDLRDFYRSKVQSGLKYVPLLNSSDTSAIDIEYPAAIENGAFRAVLSIQIDTTQMSVPELANVAIFKFDTFLNLWIRQESLLQKDTVSLPINQSGRYAVFNANDHVAPTIEVTANGRPLIKDMLVIKKPALALLLQDENGVNYAQSLSVRVDEILLVQDGKALSQQEVSIPDSLKNAKAISVTTSPSLQPGKHKLTVSVADVNGNTATEEYEFVVTDGFGDIRVFGNYPNPFSDQTIISFYVDSDNELDNFSVKIYTTSGRLIRKTMLTLDESVATDNVRTPYYHELVWDGTDDDGVQVANGVYFAVISGTYKGKTITHTLKIARLQ